MNRRCRVSAKPKAIQVAMLRASDPKKTRSGDPVMDKDLVAIEFAKAINEGYTPMDTEKIEGSSLHVEQAQKTMGHIASVIQESAKDLAVQTDKILDSSRRATQGIRQAADALSQGLIRIEKTANLDKLERHAEVLVKITESFRFLAELEASGKLEKIASVLK
jgi:hypothetical protein